MIDSVQELQPTNKSKVSIPVMQEVDLGLEGRSDGEFDDKDEELEEEKD